MRINEFSLIIDFTRKEGLLSKNTLRLVQIRFIRVYS